MKCHYEILGVNRNVDESEIKTAYRRLALRWHPDKNLTNTEEATEQFQLVQQAYDVLSDPHERAWYDNHRDQILRGKHSDYQENCLDLFPYFTATCYKGFGDDPCGFYHIYSEVFEKIAAEDLEFIDDEEKINEIPKFGCSTSNYDVVVGPFYAYWQSYCTKKSYSWLCPYNINEIKDRRVLREIEKDMKKIVSKAKKERNDEVRNLVKFIRKRDKRVQAQKELLEKISAANRIKYKQNCLDQFLKRKLEIEEAIKNQTSTNLIEDYDEQLRQLEDEYKNSDNETDDNNSQDFLDIENLNIDETINYNELYCVACNKTFKNSNAFLNHETSKRHRENIEKIKLEMKKDDNLCDKNYETDSSEIILNTTIKETKSKKNKKSKRSQVLKHHSDNEQSSDELLKQISSEEEIWVTNKKQIRKSKQKKSIEKKNETNEEVNIENPKINEIDLTKTLESNNVDIDHICVTCQSTFPSKNKLFSHLKNTNHGVYLPKEKKLQKSNPELVNNSKRSKHKK